MGKVLAWTCGFIVAGAVFYFFAGISAGPGGGGPNALDVITGNTETIERTTYNAPEVKNADVLVDDRLEDKHPTFDPDLIDSRPLDDFSVNASGAVIRLNVPILLPDHDATLLSLHPSYAAALNAPRNNRTVVLPSVNMIDGKAKQFDDGLYAAIDQASFLGKTQGPTPIVDLIKRIYDRVGPDGDAAAYLAAGLMLAGKDVPVKNATQKAELLSRFEANVVRSKPIGFYTWSKTLSDAFRFYRYFQTPISPVDKDVANSLAQAIKADPALSADYRRALGFQAKLSNPTRDDSIADLIDGKEVFQAGRVLSLLPESTSRETELFEVLFPHGLPEGADLMGELVRRIRSGEVKLEPKPDSGWYDYQVHALETLLLPERAEEKDKLLLTKSYKARMLEAFKALMTKRRETHVRNAKTADAPASAAEFSGNVEPRLRLEPNPSYYLRTARAYAFLGHFLEAAVKPDAFKSLHGLKEGGERTIDLATELASMRDLFYGFHLVSAEDIGLKPKFAAGETVDAEKCMDAATSWLKTAGTDPDLAADTRVSVPVYIDLRTRTVKLWTTLGVRLAKLDASYAVGPKMRPKAGGAWKEVEPWKLHGVSYLIPVDEFAEVSLAGLRVLNREEFRAVCNREKTKEAIVKALESQP